MSPSHSDFKIWKRCVIVNAFSLTSWLDFGRRKNQFNKHEFNKMKIEYNRIRVARFQQPGTRFLNRVISQLTIYYVNALHVFLFFIPLCFEIES